MFMQYIGRCNNIHLKAYDVVFPEGGEQPFWGVCHVARLATHHIVNDQNTLFLSSLDNV